MVGEKIMKGNGLVERCASNLHGVLSCFDRVIIVGTLPGACYAQGMTSFLYQKSIRIFTTRSLPIRCVAGSVTGRMKHVAKRGLKLSM